MGGSKTSGSVRAGYLTREGGKQGQATAGTWRALRDAAQRYADTDTSPAGDAAFMRNREALAVAAIRWVLMLPAAAPVVLLGGLAGERWRRFARSALVLAEAIEDEGTVSPVVSSRVRVAMHRLRGHAAVWVKDGGARFDLGERAARVGGAA